MKESEPLRGLKVTLSSMTWNQSSSGMNTGMNWIPKKVGFKQQKQIRVFFLTCLMLTHPILSPFFAGRVWGKHAINPSDPPDRDLLHLSLSGLPDPVPGQPKDEKLRFGARGVIWMICPVKSVILARKASANCRAWTWNIDEHRWTSFVSQFRFQGWVETRMRQGNDVSKRSKHIGKVHDFNFNALGHFFRTRRPEEDSIVFSRINLGRENRKLNQLGVHQPLILLTVAKKMGETKRSQLAHHHQPQVTANNVNYRD